MRNYAGLWNYAVATLPLPCLLRKSTIEKNVRPKCYNININKKENNPMGNIADEFYDEYYATTCPECKENAVDAYEEKCTHCLLEEMSATYNEDIALEMSLGLDY
jgi:hypothetical protein